MQLSLLFALAMGNLALGQFTNATNDNPQLVGGAIPVGCLSDPAGFPGWALVVSTDHNSIDFCAASCPSAFFGVHNTECYCGNALDTTRAQLVSDSLCSARCPGNPRQTCGGMLGLGKRQAVPSTVLLTVYKRPDLVDGGDGGKGDHGHPHWPPHGHGEHDPSTTTPLPTYTTTVTSTSTGTITSCPPDVKHCPVGKKTTCVKTLTSTWCPEPTPIWKKKKITCYGNYCAPDQKCHGKECKNHRVICKDGKCWAEECPESDPDSHKLVICKGDKCKYADWNDDECKQKKIVCYDGKCAQEKCWGEECHKKFVCKDPSCKDCEHKKCDGKECYKKVVCKDGKCGKPEEPCKGPKCPCPPEPKPMPEPKPCHGPWCPKPVKPCHGPECHEKYPKPEPKPYPPGPAPTGGVYPPHNTPVVVVGGSDRALPAVGITLVGAIAGLAFLL